MEDFLKNRPTVPSRSAGEPGHEAPAASPGPFAALRREGPVAAVATGEARAIAATADCQSEGGASVQTVMERGRVTKLIVTCSCGKVTELACSY